MADLKKLLKNKKCLLAISVLFVCINSNKISADELGGFNISTGTENDYDNWSQWDEEISENSYEESSNISNDSEQESDTKSETYVYEESKTEDTKTIDSDIVETDVMGVEEASTYAEESTESLSVSTISATPSVIPTTVPSPTLIPTATPTPQPSVTFTPIPTVAAVMNPSTIIGYSENYSTIPSKCREKMKLYYWNLTVENIKSLEIAYDTDFIIGIISVRLNSKETLFKEKNNKILLDNIDIEESGYIEVAALCKARLEWTELQNNDILTYKFL